MSHITHYPSWSLQEVISRHRDRLSTFIVYDGPRFASRESATEFWVFVSDLASKSVPTESVVSILRQKYIQFPEAAVCDDVQAKLNAGNAKDVLSIMDPSVIEFPLGRETPASFIDIGCGQGFKTSAMASAWALPRNCAIGLDIVCPVEIPDNFTFQLMTSHNSLPQTISGNSQDLAILSMVLHHAEDPGSLLRAIRSALRPGGYLVIRDHNVESGNNQISDFLNTVHILYDTVFGGKDCIPNAQNYKSLEIWLDLCRDYGFQHVKTIYTPFQSGTGLENPNTIEKFTSVLRVLKE